MKRRTLYIDLYDCFKRLFALFNQIIWRSMNSTPKAQNANEPGATHENQIDPRPDPLCPGR